ncbi:MAG: hypothetical protein ACOYUK_05180 [Patescibacteria group bacterium]
MDIDWIDVVKFFHIGGVVVGMGAAVFMHLQFIRRGLTWGQLKNYMGFGSRVIWVGLVIAILSGIIFWIILPNPRPDIFFVKLGLVAMLVIDGVMINRIGRPKLMMLNDSQLMTALPPDVRRTFMISGVISVVGWWGAFAIGIL